MQNNPSNHPDETANEFIQLVEDLGYSKTFYPSTGVVKYLNTEATKRYLHIYVNQKHSWKRVVRFFKTDLPLIVGKHHSMLLISFILFLLFVLIGFFSAKGDESFVRMILGDSYVNMTERNIESGRPFGVYDQGNELVSFLELFMNNVSVGLRAFGGGLLLGIPTIFMVVYNGIMVGAFEYMFYSKGLMADSLLTIMIHGTIELSTLVVAATSGLVLAKSWLFPGTLSRKQAFKTGAKEGVIIAMANFPMLCIAAFFEGFVTRHAGMPIWLKLLIIGASLTLMLGYFVVYPIILRRRK